MIIEPIAYFRSPLTSKFGIPRQSGLAENLTGDIVFQPAYSSNEAVRGLENFDYVWIIWGFSANRHEARRLTVRPPRLGGNRRVGVFASRSPFRPNGLGLSSVRITGVEQTVDGPVIHVLGADLMDGTPIFDVKPYIPYADSHPGARAGFTDDHQWQPLRVEMSDELRSLFTSTEQQGLLQVLAQDPRPRYHTDGERVYGMPFAGRDVRFYVKNGVLTVISVVEAHRS